jgi:hypothetical protein
MRRGPVLREEREVVEGGEMPRPESTELRRRVVGLMVDVVSWSFMVM